MQGPAKKLSFSAVLLAMLAGVIGGGIGFVLGIALGSGLATAFHVSSMEGTAGYFAVGIALIVTVLSAPAAILLTLYWRGVRKIWLFVGLVVSLTGIGAVAASGLGLWYMGQPHILHSNGPTPLLQFEIKPPEGQSLESLAHVETELDTDQNVMPAYWNKDTPNSGVRAGYVEVYFRTSRRLFILKLPNHEDRIFRLRLPANPMKPKYREWSDWQKPDFTAKGAEQPTRASGGLDYQIRYKVDYQDR